MAVFRDRLGSSIGRNKGRRVYTELVIIPSDDVPGNEDEKLVNALALLPADGSFHPTHTALRLENVSGGVANNGSYRFSLSWEDPEGDGLIDTTGIVEFTGIMTSDTVLEDRNGAPMTGVWDGNLHDIYPASGFANAPVASPITFHYSADRQRASFGVTLTRRETSIAVVRQRAFDFTGKLNSSTWSGGLPKTWMCLPLRLTQNGDEIRVEYRFAYKPEEWNPTLPARFNGRVPQNATLGNGIEQFEIYEEIDFNLLPVSF